MIKILIVVGLALSVSSSLRIGVVGPSEILLCLAGVISLALNGPVLGRIGRIQCAVMAAMLVGTLIAIIFGHYFEEGFLWNFSTMVYNLFIAFSLFGWLEGRSQYLVEIWRWLVLSICVILLVMLFFGQSFGLETDWGGRFKGMSENPNQVTFQLACIPFFALAVYKGRWAPIGWILAATSVYLAWQVKSDALGFGYLAGALVMLIVFRRSFWMVGVMVILLPIMLIVFELVSGGVLAEWVDYAYNKNSGAGDNRMILWENGLRAWTYSPVFGWGYGMHSGEIGPFEGWECHDVYIEMLTKGGLVAFSVMAFYYLKIIRNVLLDCRLAGAFVSLLVVGVFHSYDRHVWYWFCLMSLASIALIDKNYNKQNKSNVHVRNRRHF